MRYPSLLLLSISLVVLFVPTVQAEVVEDANIEFNIFPDTVSNYGFVVGQEADDLDVTCVLFDWNNGDVSGDVCIDESNDWFVVQDGDEFSSGTVGLSDGQTGFPDSQFPRFLDAQYSLNVGDEFFIAVATPISLENSLPEAYGWVKLRVTGTEQDQSLEMLDNAITYCGNGIFIGTSEIVPEPGSLCLMMLAGAWLFGIRRRK